MTDFKECATRRQPPLQATNDGSQHCFTGQSISMSEMQETSGRDNPLGATVTA
jgi:hypothetical protein